MGAPNITGTFTGSVTEGSGLVIGGNLDDGSGNIWADTWSISGAPAYGIASVDATGNWTYDLNDTNPVVAALNTGDTLTDTFTVQLSDGGGTDTQVITITIQGTTPPCFTPGTLIATPQGQRPVERIVPGDMVLTRDHGARTVLWTGRRRVAAEGNLAPIAIAAGTLGNRREIIVSPQHRVCIGGWAAELHCGAPEVLVAAAHLVDGKNVRRLPGGEVTYLHLMFDRHEMIWAEGMLTESFFPGGAVAGEIARTEAELRRLFDDLPGLAEGAAAAYCATRTEARVLRAALLETGAA
jgi:VCBS repeat-containing protein